MNPPLDAMPVYTPEPRLPVPGRHIVTPDTLQDLRGHSIDELHYPTTAALVVAGVPGAGKSTALLRFFGATADAENPPSGPSGSIVLDSQHARNRWRRRLGWLPYPLWRPVVHLAHFFGIRAALRDVSGPVVIHDCATFGWTRRLIARWSRRYGRELHVILIDVPATVARAGQFARGRRINGIFFTLHCFRWRRLVAALDTGRVPRPAPTSMVLVDRSTVDRISTVRFAA